MALDYVFNGKPSGGTPTTPSLALDENLGQIYYATKRTGGWKPIVAVATTSSFNVLDYGAVGDGLTDDYQAVQSAIDAASVASADHVTVFFPAGTYYCTKPLRVYKSNIALVGEGRQASMIVAPSTFHGPVLSVAPQVGNTTGFYPEIPLADALVGTGKSYLIDGTQGIQGFEFRESGLDVDGLGAFCVEFWFKTDPSMDTASRVLMNCAGTFDPQLTHQTLTIGIDNQTVLTARADIGGIQSLTATVALNTVYHLAFTYDGTTLRLFLNGVLQSSAVVSGTLSQKFYENWTVGFGSTNQWPLAGSNNAPIKGQIDSIRISNEARYTSNFTVPTSKLTFDANTLYLQNWDNIVDMFAVAETVNGNCYNTYQRTTAGAEVSASINNVMLNNIGFSGTVYMNNCILAALENVYIENARFGLWLENNCYLSTIRNLKVFANSSTLGCLILGPSNNLMQIDSPELTSGKVLFVEISSSGTMTNPWFELNSLNEAAVLFVQGTWNVVGGGMSTENGTSAALVKNISAYSCDSLVIDNLNVEVAQVAGLSVYGGTAITLRNVAFRQSDIPQPASVIDIPTAPDRPITLLNCIKTGFTGVWCSDFNSAAFIRDGYNNMANVSGALMLNAENTSKFILNLTGNVSSVTIFNVVPGQQISILVKQDATGGRTINWGASFVNPVALNSGANAITGQEFLYDGTKFNSLK